MQPSTSQSAQAQQTEVQEEERGRRWLTPLVVTLVILALGAVAFFAGFKVATESDLTVGDVLRFIRQMYQWFGAR